MAVEKLALKVDDKDNVATIFANEVDAGCTVTIQDKKGVREEITVRQAIPYGHKIAVADLKKGDRIMKYGECIGAASMDFQKGDYVHVHNLEALRGRGDL